MKSLQEVLLESIENLQDVDKILTVGGLGSRVKKTPSGKKVIWASSIDLGSMYIPGKGYLTNQKLETFRGNVRIATINALGIPTNEIYGEPGMTAHYKPCYEVDLYIQGVYEANNVKTAKKMERALDYAVGLHIGVPEYALDKFNENDLKRLLADFFSVSQQDIVSRSSGIIKPDPKAVVQIAQSYEFTIYLTYGEFATFATTIK